MLRAEYDLKVDLEKVKKEWIGYYKLKEWEHIIRTYKDPDGSVEKIVSWVLEEIIVEFNWNDRLFVKRMKISWYDDIFSPKKFKRFYSPIKIDKK